MRGISEKIKSKRDVAEMTVSVQINSYHVKELLDDNIWSSK